MTEHSKPAKSLITLLYSMYIILFGFFIGGKDALQGFPEFIYKEIVPACFMAPMKPTFDLDDGQTTLVSISIQYTYILLRIVVCVFWIFPATKHSESLPV